ncbi:MAG: DUF2878 domain-containing protein [Planctomycetota bacterium]|nr:MAG: DUF2878 domain-containing protein [Planctomycetota bacterium]
MGTLAINIVAFHVFWFACVLGGAWNRGWYAPAALAAIVAVHLLHARDKNREFELLVACGAFGTAADTLLMYAGMIAFPAGSWVPWLCPFWMTALWIGFATLLNVSLAWLRGRFLLAAFLGFFAGPLSYYAGSRLGALSLSEGAAVSLAVIAVEWAVAMPILLLLAARADRGRTASSRFAEAAAS